MFSYHQDFWVLAALHIDSNMKNFYLGHRLYYSLLDNTRNKYLNNKYEDKDKTGKDKFRK